MVDLGTLGNLCALGWLRVTFGLGVFPSEARSYVMAFSTLADCGHNIYHCHVAESCYCPVPLRGCLKFPGVSLNWLSFKN